MGDILQTSFKDAERFYKECQAYTKGLTLQNKGDWWIYVEKGQVLGMISTQQIGKWKRIKSLLVRSGHTGKGIATELVKHVSTGDCTAFAFDSSKTVFEKCGFVVEKQNKNGNWFLRKQDQEVKQHRQIKKTYKSPVYNVQAIPIENIQANAYNPNAVAPPEMKLLYQSIKEDGYTMPIVCYALDDGLYEIVDGFHRYSIMKKYKDIYERENGFIPVSVIDKPIENRMASTVRHNRARGEHSIELMTNIIHDLVKSGMSDAWILKNLGMDLEELTRLKQVSGLASLFADKDFSKSWE